MLLQLGSDPSDDVNELKLMNENCRGDELSVVSADMRLLLDELPIGLPLLSRPPPAAPASPSLGDSSPVVLHGDRGFTTLSDGVPLSESTCSADTRRFVAGAATGCVSIRAKGCGEGWAARGSVGGDGWIGVFARAGVFVDTPRALASQAVAISRSRPALRAQPRV